MMQSHEDIPSNFALSACANKLTGFERREGIEHRRHERLEVHQAIGWCTKKKHTERQCRQILLELDALVHRDQRVVLAPHPPQKLAVRVACPATTAHGVDTVALERCRERLVLTHREPGAGSS